MFKHAYVRGIQTALVNSGAAAFPDEGTANKVADYIADRVDIDLSQPVAREVSHKVATDLVAASDWIKRQPGFKAAAWNKLATWDDVTKLADHHATQLMTKAAEGSTIEGGDKGNDEAQAPAAETKMDAAQRPPGYAEGSRGKTDVDTRPGSVGKESPSPTPPKESDSGSNSVQEHSRTASLTLAQLFKQAQGSTILGGDKGNDEPTTAEGKMDAAQRPPGYAVLPSQGALGAMMDLVTGPAVIGRETAQPVQPGESPSGSNSVTAFSAKAAAVDPYIALFKKTAAEVHEYLPATYAEDAKIAAVRACMGLTTEEKAHYLHGLQKEAAVRVAAAPANTPPGSRGDGYAQHSPEATHSRPGAYDGRRGNQGTKSAGDDLPPFMKKDDKDDDKDDKDDKDKGGKGGMPDFIQDKIDARKDGDKDDKDGDKDDKKEASLKDLFRRITNAQRASS